MGRTNFQPGNRGRAKNVKSASESTLNEGNSKKVVTSTNGLQKHDKSQLKNKYSDSKKSSQGKQIKEKKCPHSEEESENKAEKVIVDNKTPHLPKQQENQKETSSNVTQDKTKNASKNQENDSHTGNTSHGKFTLKNREPIVQESARRRDELNRRSVYIRPVPSNCTVSMLKSLAPEMCSCQIPVQHGHKTRGFAFLEFESSSIAEKQQKLLNGRMLCGETVKTGKVSSNATQLSSGLDFSVLIVTGLGENVGLSELKAVFPHAVRIRMDTSEDGKSLGSATLEFGSEGFALAAFVHAHRNLIQGKPIHVVYGLKADKKKKKHSKKKEKEEKKVVKRKRGASTGGDSEETTKETADLDSEPLAKKKKSSSTKVVAVQEEDDDMLHTLMGDAEDSSDEDDSDNE